MNAKISVIVPIYNVEKYLSKCIDSIINQTYRNLEIILVDDGSQDNCGRICDDYSLRDSRIKVVHKKNGGLSDARNVGLDIATGEYVSLIDSDDYIHGQFYESLMKLIIKYNADIAQCEFLKVYEEDIPSNNKDNTNEEITILDGKKALNNLFNNNYVSTVVVWNKLYKTELFKNIRYPKSKVHEDEYTTYKILFNTHKVVSTSRSMYYYLQRSTSIMGKEFNVKRLDILEAYYGQVIFYNENKLFELEEKAKIRFEGIIRGSMSNVLNSNLHNKDKIFHDLLNYYRKNYGLFNNKLKYVSFKKKLIMFLFMHLPKFVILPICNLIYFRTKLVKLVKR